MTAQDMTQLSSDVAAKSIIWFDIDNTLYPASSRIDQLMSQRIQAYFRGLGLDHDEATRLHAKYYREYGLAIRGLTRHHIIDPVDFDQKCDGSLPLEDILKPNPALRKMLQDIDRSKARVWALTNANINHASRVLRNLGIDDLFEGVVYCDYSIPNFACKPEHEFYEHAMARAAVTNPTQCLFVDDSLKNVRAAKALGWGSSVYFREKDANRPDAEGVGVDATISDLEELRTVWAHLFKPSATEVGEGPGPSLPNGPIETTVQA
ncbi:hypothetical protein BOTBODRAFT_34213 [Botryobasidium botryosum FD-172 SS1]|uniref:Pyrimidine 5-nucleotidase n=1 Tax=Botryobasidium botryosum (strain FD-172 SS1) TaxID=930990 RepID=A0A067MLJ8_BOTB1|nr:hypothetical protein BOTBODRAFT_34213 [Botryobasidium botryosum FD-172 SS1]